MKPLCARHVLRGVTMSLSLVVGACGGGGSNGPTIPDPGGPGPNPPPTRARINIQVVTSVPTIWGGEIFGRSGATSATRAQFATSNVLCGSGLPRECTWTVNVGDTVTLVANDVLADPSIFLYGTVTDPDDRRSIESQFVSFGSPCIARERGVCAFRVTGDVTVTAQFKALTLTRFFFSGLNPWAMTVTAPPKLTLGSLASDAPTITYAHYGVASTAQPYGRCIGEAPGVRCLSVLTPDNANIKMEVYPPQGVIPPDSPGPLNFVGWGGACSAAPSQFGLSACNLTSGIDQIAIVKWEYYRCFTPEPNRHSFAVEGNGGWKIEPGSSLIDGCTLTQ